MNAEQHVQLMDEISQFYDDPVGFALFAFDWGVGELKGFELDQWQIEFLTDVGEEVKVRGFDGVNAVDPIQFATASGHGIGKSALTAILILWIMSTRPNAKGVVTANTATQLKTKTMAELAKWHSRCITRDWFEVTAMSMYHVHRSDTWRVDAITSREEASEAFAGLHAADSTPFYIFDEASAIPEKIWEVANGGLTDGEPMFFAFGNPTRNTGSFKNCFTRYKHRWNIRRIDSRQARMTNKKLIQEWIDDYGEDSDFVRVRVLGKFPNASDMQLIPGDKVSEAMKRGSGRYLGDDPLICGIDVARGGGDNCFIQFRRGKDAKSEKVYKIPAESSRDSTRLISLIVTVLDRHKPDITFLDETGLGGPMVDRLVQLGYNVTGVNFGSKAIDDTKFGNKVAENWWRTRAWLFDGGAIVDNDELERQLTEREYTHDKKDRLLLQPKEELPESPDWADALSLTFSYPVPPRDTQRGDLDAGVGYRANPQKQDYNPIDKMNSDDFYSEVKPCVPLPMPRNRPINCQKHHKHQTKIYRLPVTSGENDCGEQVIQFLRRRAA